MSKGSHRRTRSSRRLVALVSSKVARCRNLLTAVSRRSIDRSNLTLPQFELLGELSRAGARGRTFVELSRELLVTSGNLTGVVDRLEAIGLARRRRDHDDRRIIWVALTSKGRRVMRGMLPRHALDLDDAVAFMPRVRLKRLSTLLDELSRGLDARVDRQPRLRRT